MLLDLDDDVDRGAAAGTVRLDVDGVVDRRQGAVCEFDVDDGADDLDDFADLLCCWSCCCHVFPSYRAWAPETTSMISRVIAA